MRILITALVSCALVHAVDQDAGAANTLAEVAADYGLQVNICKDISGDKFLCEKIFSKFCTYCRKDSGNECVTKHGVPEAEAEGYQCEGEPSPSPEPSPPPSPSPAPEPSPSHHHHHHSPKPEPGPPPPHHHDHSPKPEPGPPPPHHHHDEVTDAAMQGTGHLECHFANKASCNVHPSCEWCHNSMLAGGACYTHNQASQLPKALFECSRS